jgi:hypothetical protein
MTLLSSHVIEIPVSLGELIDKISILQIKSERVTDATKLENIFRELELLEGRRRVLIGDDVRIHDLAARLKVVNECIWSLEDTIRECECRNDFEDVFIQTARQIYRTNDARASLKRELNLIFGSHIVEEKSYKPY